MIVAVRRALLAIALLVCACGGAERRAPEMPTELDADLRAAYLNEDASAVRIALNGHLLPPGYRRALELSRLLQDGECRREDLEVALAQNPTWVAFVEHGDCVAQVGREREALEDFVHAVDLADTPESVDYVVRRVCRAADESGLVTLQAMCVGWVQ